MEEDLKLTFNTLKKGILAGLEEINNSPPETSLAETININTFDYSSVDEDTALFLQEKAQKIREIRVKSVILIGKELSDTFDKLSKVDYGERTKTFDKWVESIGISSRHARRYIESYKYIEQNFLSIEDAEKIQPSLLFEISKPSAPKELEQKVLSGDIKSHKEYKELEQKLKQERDRARIAEQKLTQIADERDTFLHEKKLYEEQIEILREEINQIKNNRENDENIKKVIELEEKISKYQQMLQQQNFMKETLSKRICETLDFISSLTIEEVYILGDRAADKIYKAKQNLEKIIKDMRGGEKNAQ